MQTGKRKTATTVNRILPEVSGSYGKIKKVCETDLGIVSQCCLPRHAARPNKQYMENVALKINVKIACMFGPGFLSQLYITGALIGSAFYLAEMIFLAPRKEVEAT